MARPDQERIQRAAWAIYDGAGETALLRSYVSGATGAAKYGVHNTFNYLDTTITGLFTFGGPVELAQAGGESYNARLSVTTRSKLHTRDQLIWQGSAWQLDGPPMPEHLGGRILYRSPLKLLGATG